MSDTDSKDNTMAYYLVFAAQAVTVQDPNPVHVGGRAFEYQHRATGELAWSGTPVGVFVAEDPESACRSAAQKSGTMGTFFAIEGFPWGVSLMSQGGAHELGMQEPPRRPEIVR